jgi:hypothetical protein
VIVAVDFAPWGGDIVRGCDATVTTGYDALQAAGFTTAGDEHDGPAFICRINDDPPPSQDPCIDTPPTSAYWSYWHADVGQNTWSYSQLGVMSYHPPPGSVDAWVFGAANVAGTTGQPPFTPDQVRATNAGPVGGTPTTTTTPTSSVASSPAVGGGSSPPVTSAPSSPGSKSPTGSGSSAAASSSSRSASTSSTLASGTTSTTAAGGEKSPTATPKNKGRDADGGKATKIVNASPTAAKQPSAGSPLPFVLGAVLVVGLLGGGSVVAVRRRRAAQAQEE